MTVSAVEEKASAYRDVRIISAIIAVYGLANGIVLNTTPQASLHLGMRSQDLGLIGAGLPMGYALSCLLYGQIFARVPSKYVLLGGTLAAIASIVAMSLARTTAACVTAQVCYGLASGAFWPFSSAWLIGFQAAGISKPTLLRHYNLSWTSGTALGLYVAGLLCKNGLINESFCVSAALCCVVFILGCIPHAVRKIQQNDAPLPRSRSIGLALVLPAVIANLAAIGTRSIIMTNYAELNAMLHFGPERMGLFGAFFILSQLVAFVAGGIYESWLGLRRVYFFLAASLIVVNLAFACCTSLAVLLPCAVLTGFVLALSFQTGIVAATEYFASPRTGTTFHESIVGAGGAMPLMAGMIVGQMKQAGATAEDALREPFVDMAGAILVAFAMQVVLVSMQQKDRVLLPRETPTASRT